MTAQLHGAYVGAREDIKGEKALLLRNHDGSLMAQFDNLNLPPILTHNWSQFQAIEFKIDEPYQEQENSMHNPHHSDCNCIVCLPEPHSRFR